MIDDISAVIIEFTSEQEVKTGAEEADVFDAPVIKQDSYSRVNSARNDPRRGSTFTKPPIAEEVKAVSEVSAPVERKEPLAR